MFFNIYVEFVLADKVNLLLAIGSSLLDGSAIGSNP